MKMTRIGQRRAVRSRSGPARSGVVIALALIGAASLTTEGVAQTPEEEPVRVEEWIGRWSGPFDFEGDGPSGSVSLVLAIDGEEWAVVSELLAEGAPPPGEVLGWVVREDRFSYVQWYDAIELTVRGRLVEGELVGELEAAREGERLGGTTFRLRREALRPTPTDEP
jgi:hypothetical protein